MKRYTYRIHYTTALVTEVKECETPIDWNTLKPGILFRFDSPQGSQLVNMNYVVAIEEIVTEIDDYFAEGMMLGDALVRNHFSANKTAEELGWSPRTVYRKAKQHNLNVKEDYL